MISHASQACAERRLPDTQVLPAHDVAANGYAIAQFVLEIGAKPFRVREDARTPYHAALAHAGNHVITVVSGRCWMAVR